MSFICWQQNDSKTKWPGTATIYYFSCLCGQSGLNWVIFLLQVPHSTKSLIQPLQSARISAETEISKMVSFTYLEVGVSQLECYCAHGFSSASRLNWLSYSMTTGYKEGKAHFCTRTYQISACIMFANVPLAMQVTWPKPSLLCTYEETEVSCD